MRSKRSQESVNTADYPLVETRHALSLPIKYIKRTNINLIEQRSHFRVMFHQLTDPQP